MTFYRLGAATVDITPGHPVPLAGVVGRRSTWQAIRSPLQANAVLLAGGDQRLLLLSADLLYIGPDLDAAVRDEAQALGLPASHVIVAASHTHFAPATDRSKPPLGEVDAEFLRQTEQRLRALVRTVVTGPLTSVRAEHVRQPSDAGINRRRRWPWPTWTRDGLRFGPSTVMAPNADGPRDEHLDVLRFTDAQGRIRAIVWKLACHPVCFPASREVCAEYPGMARQAMRARVGTDVPIVFLQGFTGDVRPRLLGTRRWVDRVQALRRGPGFGEVTAAQWESWAGRIADGLCRAALEAEGRPVDGPLVVAAAGLPLNLLVDASRNPDRVGRALGFQCVRLGPGLELLAIAAEVCSPYLAALQGDGTTLCVGYVGDVFGYLPDRRQIAEGGYEGDSFLQCFGLAGPLRAGTEQAVVDAVAGLRRELSARPQAVSSSQG